jgi:molybdenum cofactor synthesis domain-containing protein
VTTAAAGLPVGASALVVTVSDRSAAGTRPDTSGPLLVELLQSLGFQAAKPVVVPDDADEVEAALRAGVRSEVDLVVTTGGTGLGPRDVTPEATMRVLDRLAPGIAEALRQFNREQIPTTILSRAVAGVSGRTLVVNLPGSAGGVRDGVAVLTPVIGHAIAQLRGGDH